MTLPEPSWQTALPVADLPPRSMKPMKLDGHALVLIHAEDGTFHALDNHCPHEGYALAQGELEGCLLTCAWHNWKFDVRSGECTLGGEDVRRYPIRLQDGRLEVDLTDPDPKEQWEKWRASLQVGLHEPDLSRAVRDAVRLLESGFSPWQLLADVAIHDARHAEYGTSHVLPVAADAGAWMARFEGSERLHAIAPALEMCIESDQRLPRRPQPEPRPGAELASLLAAAEAEDAETAEALLLGAFQSGIPRPEIERWLYRVIAEHFTDFGHQLIYLVKAQELMQHVSDEVAQELYPALLYGTILGTREDTLPYMKRYFEPLADLDLGSIEDVDEHPSHEALARITAASVEGTVSDATGTIIEALRAGISRRRIADALVDAAAERVLRFDQTLEHRDDTAENWLWATHRLTFASAVREAVERFDSPEALRFLFQTAAFTHSGRAMDAEPAEPALEPRVGERPLEVLAEALKRREPELALAAARHVLEIGGSVHAIHELAQEHCLSEQYVRPIFLAHAIKTWNVGWEESHRLGPPSSRPKPLLAALRFLASPLRERRTAQTVRTSIAWVRDGKIPRKLTQ